MIQLVQFIQSLSYPIAKWIDKLKYESIWKWGAVTLSLILILIGIHLNWFTFLSDTIKTALTALITGILAIQAPKTTDKVKEVQSTKDKEIVENKPVYDVNKPVVEEIKEPVQPIQEPLEIIVEPIKESCLKIEVKRHTFNVDSTVSDLFIDGKYFCKILEDRDRGLDSKMSLTEINKKKVYGQTCIPQGTYQVITSYSNKFKKFLPELLNVPGYEGIRIHKGNSDIDSSGCLLTITNFKDGKGIGSTRPFNMLFNRIKQEQEKQKIFLTIGK